MIDSNFPMIDLNLNIKFEFYVVEREQFVKRSSPVDIPFLKGGGELLLFGTF